MWNVWGYFVSLAYTVRREENIYRTVLSWTVEMLLWSLITKVNLMNFVSTFTYNTVAFLWSWHLLLNYWSERTFHQWDWFLIQLFFINWLIFILAFNDLKACFVIYDIFFKVIEINSYFWIFAFYFISRSSWLFRYSSTWIHLKKLGSSVW